MNAPTIPRKPTLQAGFRYLRFLALAAAMSLSAVQPAVADSGSESEQKNQRQTLLTGSWFVNVARPGLPDLLALQTYFADGNLLEESNSTAIRSLGHGSWESLGKRQFSRSFLVFTFDAARNFTGHSERFHNIEVSKDGQTFENLGGTLSRFDTEGNLVSTVTEAGGGEKGRRLFSD